MSDRIARVLSRLPGLREKITEEIRTLVRQPRNLASLIEGQSPWLSRQFLGVASNVVEPFLLGTGVTVSAIGEEVSEVALPNVWRNQGERGVVHNAAISAVCELASRLFWERHLDVRQAEMRASSISLRILSPPRESLKAIFRTTVTEREEVLHELRAEGSATTQASVSVYDPSGKLVAESEIEWTITKQLALSGTQS